MCDHVDYRANTKRGMELDSQNDGMEALMFDFLDQYWRQDALCAQTDPDLFFPDVGERNPAAKAVCGRCPVREPCLATALDNREVYGIWGGLSADERKRFRAQRNRDAS